MRRFVHSRILLSIHILSFSAHIQPSALTADDIQLGYTESEPWTTVQGGYNGSFRIAAAMGPGYPRKTANWTIAVPKTNHVYRIQATWTPDRANASDARYVIFDGPKLLRSVSINQQQPPIGEKSGNSIFQDLGSFLITHPSLKVELSNDANGRVIADSVRAK